MIKLLTLTSHKSEKNIMKFLACKKLENSGMINEPKKINKIK